MKASRTAVVLNGGGGKSGSGNGYWVQMKPVLGGRLATGISVTFSEGAM